MEEIKMKIAKIIAGMSALSMAAAMAAVPVSAEEAVANSFYPATYDVTYVYSGADIAAVAGDAVVDPTEDALKDKKAQLVGYTNAETGKVDTYNLGFNIQVGHMTNAKLTIEVTSSTNNIYDGTAGTGSGFMYTVQPSWNGNSPKDDEQGWKKYEYEEDGTTQKMAWGACDINNMSTGKGKFNGEWAQITLTDTDVSALTFTVHVDCSESTWEYHPYSADEPQNNNYRVFSMTAGTVKPNNVDTYVEDPEQGFWGIVDIDEINKQIPGGVTSPEAGDSKSDSSSTADSSSTSSNTNSSSSSSSSSNTSSKTSSTTTTTSKTTTTTTTTTTASTASTAASDNTENAASGAAAGVGLAIAALAGAAIVVSRKR